MQKMTGNAGECEINGNIDARLTGGSDCDSVDFCGSEGVDHEALAKRGMKEGMEFDPGKKESCQEREDGKEAADWSADPEFIVEFWKNIETT
jgi:hypothetical protein